MFCSYWLLGYARTVSLDYVGTLHSAKHPTKRLANHFVRLCRIVSFSIYGCVSPCLDDGRGPMALLKNGHLIRELRTKMCSVLDLVLETDEER